MFVRQNQLPFNPCLHLESRLEVPTNALKVIGQRLEDVSGSRSVPGEWAVQDVGGSQAHHMPQPGHSLQT